MSDFNGRVALVTGAGSGIGWETAKLLAEGGARVVAVDRNQKKLLHLVEELPPAKLQHVGISIDLRPAKAAQEVVRDVLKQVSYIDILVNSAGICHFNKIHDISPEEWDEVLEVDLRSLFFVSIGVAESMDAARGGRIINLGSNAGRKGRALSAHYAAAKAAVSNLTESFALAYGSKNVTVNCVCPGVTKTAMWDGLFEELTMVTGKSRDELMEGWSKLTPLGRVGEPKDVAELIGFLASDKAKFITGQTINVCGGFMLTC